MLGFFNGFISESRKINKFWKNIQIIYLKSNIFFPQSIKNRDQGIIIEINRGEYFHKNPPAPPLFLKSFFYARRYVYPCPFYDIFFQTLTVWLLSFIRRSRIVFSYDTSYKMGYDPFTIVPCKP